MGLSANSKRESGCLAKLGALTLEDCCFYIALTIYLLWKIFQTSMFAIPTGSSLNTLLHFGSLALFLLSCIGHIKLDANFYMALVFGTIGILVKIFGDNIAYVDLAIIFYAAHRFDFKSIAKLCLTVCSLTCIFIVICSQTGIITDYPFARGNRIRHGLGFLYSTFLSHYYLNVVLLYLYLKPRARKRELAVLLLGNIAIYLATDSRNSFLMVILALLFMLAYPHLKNLTDSRASRLFRRFTGWSFVIFTVICFALPLAYDTNNSVWKRINSISSNRLAQTQASLYEYGIEPFGQDIELYGNGLSMNEDGFFSGKELNPDGDVNYIDSSFVRIPVYDGVVVSICLLTIMTLASQKLSRDSSSIKCMIVLITVLHASIDDLLLSLPYSSFLFIFWNYAITEIDKYENRFSPNNRILRAHTNDGV